MKHYEYTESDDCYDMAVEWLRHGNLDKAEHFLKRAIELNPRFTYAYVVLARVYGRQKKYSDAVHVLKRASRMDPTFDRLYYLMAKYACRGGDLKNALRHIERAIALSESPLYRAMEDYIAELFRRSAH